MSNRHTTDMAVVSLYDFTGEAVRPWAKLGFQCHCFDIKHPKLPYVESVGNWGGTIQYHHLDLHKASNLAILEEHIRECELDVVMGMAFPVCTDLAVSGAKHFAKKAEVNPEFQDEAVKHARWCSEFFDRIGCPYFIENPVSVLATKWRKPNYTFHPYEYGRYIPAREMEHPRWPDVIPAWDAYPKKTCLWTGGGFRMPEKWAVAIPKGYSPQYKMLGGKSERTKMIRSATPRGFARAVLVANAPAMRIYKPSER